MKQKLALDSPASYEIEVQGYLEAHWSDWFDRADIIPRVDSEGVSVTRLTARITDQAALHGLLRKLYDLGLPLLSVNLTPTR
jgi:hypothetical protein